MFSAALECTVFSNEEETKRRFDLKLFKQCKDQRKERPRKQRTSLSRGGSPR
jgi:hypothetical protein